ncbi:MAG: Ldh family oxidoreductase [Planctomycetota bacterium]|nr:Ldh family oxidoreductase [Planctomycetota bacterium]
MPVLPADKLTDLTERLFVAAGVTSHESRILSAGLVGANLRGYDSHGVMRIPFYIAAMQDGRVRPGTPLKIEKETPALLVCDGAWGLGQVLAHDLVERLIAKASEVGVAAGTLRQAAHIGRVGEYAEQAAAAEMAAIICANSHGSGQRVAPVGGTRGRLGTNPLSIGMPGGKDGPFILDFGTSATAEGKVRVKKIASEKVPLGWILDPDGNPTTDPNQLYGNPPGSILPMGGDQAYKGFGLAFLIEMLAGGLSGGLCSHPNAPPPVGNDVLFVILDPKHLGGLDHLRAQIGILEPFVRETPRRAGVDRVILPGTELVKLAEKLGVSLP